MSSSSLLASGLSLLSLSLLLVGSFFLVKSAASLSQFLGPDLEEVG